MPGERKERRNMIDQFDFTHPNDEWMFAQMPEMDSEESEDEEEC